MTRVSLDIPPGLNGNDTSFSASPRWSDGSNVRFDRGRAQVIGGWELINENLLTGVCRTAFQWTDNDAVLNIGFGTNSALQVLYDSLLATITPTKALPPVTLGANPLTVTNGSPVVTVAHKGHGLTSTESIVVSGATAVGGITPNGTFPVTVTGVDSYTFTFGGNASSGATGGGSAVVITPQRAFTEGAVDGTGGAGYGTGAYGVGGYGEPSTVENFPRTWALAAWGEYLLANPRGGTIYEWRNNPASPALPLANAPRQVNHMVVASANNSYWAFALGCNEEASGIFNPTCIRHCGVRNNAVWNTADSTTAREYTLPGGGRIVAGRVIGSYILVWTNHSLFLGRYNGAPSAPWIFDKVGDKCGLIGPNAAIVVGQTAYWIGPDRQFYTYGIGGAPTPISCPISNDLGENLTYSQADKIVASSISAFAEIRFDYPDARDGDAGIENSRYIAAHVPTLRANPELAWFKGSMSRSAFVDAGPSDDPIGVEPSGAFYWHERGKSANGAPFSWFIETADQYLDENRTSTILGMWPDVADQQGPVSIAVTSRLKPQGEDTARTIGPYAMAPGQDKVDLRLSGRLFKLRFSGSSAPTAARLGRPVLQLAPGGGR